MIQLKDLPDYPTCPKCGSSALGMLRMEDSGVQSLLDKRGEKLTKSEQKISGQAARTARLISKFGKIAAVSLSGRNMQISDAEEILEKENHLSNRYFELITEAEKKSLKRKFW